MGDVAQPPAVLFWFYRDPELCANRLHVLRRFNPDCRIFGLYGGAPDAADMFQQRLAGLLDDFYTFDAPAESWWKWINGDLVIRAWYEERGRRLDWQAIAVVQWDMLVLGPLQQLVGTPAADEVILSGLRPVSEVEPWWAWVNGPDRATFDGFMDHLSARHGYTGPAWCCQFIVACLGRAFLEAYASVDEPELGFIEYRVPTYASVFGMQLRDAPVQCWWEGDPSMIDVPRWRRVLSAQRTPVPLRHLLRVWLADGATIAHPYRGTFPTDVRSSFTFMRRGVARAIHGLRPGTP
jgi:hypothetical protein